MRGSRLRQCGIAHTRRLISLVRDPLTECPQSYRCACKLPRGRTESRFRRVFQPAAGGFTPLERLDCVSIRPCEVVHARTCGPELDWPRWFHSFLPWRHDMKTLVTTFALAALVAASGIANAASRPASDVVVLGGKVIGQDPDANIRAAIVKDAYPTGD